MMDDETTRILRELRDYWETEFQQCDPAIDMRYHTMCFLYSKHLTIAIAERTAKQHV